MIWTRACGLSSPRSTEAPIPMDGRRSATTTTRGDSSANNSWTMNTSLSRAAERRADDGQSIQAASSPIWYSREPATSEPVPRRALLTPPNAGPTTRRRGMSGNVPAVTLRRRRGDVEVDVDARLQPGQWMAAELLFHDPVLVLRVRIAECGADEEAVELRLRQRERALVLDRVLGRHDEERRGEQACDSVDGHLLLGHRLEQRGLRLRHRAVDLVHEDDVGEHRPGPDLEVRLALVEDREAGHVGRLQVRRALDPGGVRSLDRLRDRPGEHRFRGAR